MASVVDAARKGVSIVVGAATGGGANAGWFGDGRDGDLYVADGETLVLDVALDEGQVVKQYKSVYIGAGATVKTSGRCNGMVWLVQGKFECHGHISMDKRSPLVNDMETLCASEPHIRLCGLKGGKGGNGGGGVTGNGGTQYYPQYGLTAYTSGGIGSEGHALGGGFPGGGGGAGSYTQSTQTDYLYYFYPVANGADGTRAPIGTQIPYPHPSTDYHSAGMYGTGGNSYKGYSSVAPIGGSGYGGSGAANHPYKQSNDYITVQTAVAGNPGDGIGGGMFALFCGGAVHIGAAGVISADGGAGADAVRANPNYSYWSGAGGGAGGGIVAIVHTGDYTNAGSVRANGGKAGSNSAVAATDGDAGAVLISTLAELLSA